MSQSIDTLGLAPPDIIEAIDFEQYLNQLRAELITQNPALEQALALESEPMNILLEAFAYREMLLRARINEAAKANLLAYASNNDLDHLAAFYGVVRAPSESDDNFRARIKDRILGSSTAGGEAHYRYKASSVSTDITDVAVDSPMPGLVRISILTKSGADIDTLLQQVRETVGADDVKVLTDTLEVVHCELIEVDISADIRLKSGMLPVSAEHLEQSLRQAIEQERQLGWDLTPSWLISELHTDSVKQVELHHPMQNITIGPNQCIKVRSVSLNLDPQVA